MIPRLRERFLPQGYQAGEFPGESLTGELARRASWKALPEPVVRWLWTRVVLRSGFFCFILGVNNSGTTLLHDLVAQHPDVRSLPGDPIDITEGHWFTNALPKATGRRLSRCFSAEMDRFRRTEADDPRPAIRALHDWAWRYLGESGKVFLEKSPPHAVRSRWLQEHFPRPRFIVIFRHPAAVAEGIRRREAHSIGEAARHWADTSRVLLSDLEHLDRHLVVRYEELCAEPGETLAELADFLSLDPEFWEEPFTGLDVHSLDESVDTVENFNPRSFDRLSADDWNTITSETRAMADRLDYDLSNRGPGSR